MPVSLYAQNDLVPNGGFDEITSCPTESGQLYLALPWTNTVAGSPDLYNKCSNGSVSLPVNPGGVQNARSGSGCAGFHAFNNNNGREFLQVKLLHPMVYGTSYQVLFYVNLRDKSKYSVSTLGAYLSDTLVIREDYSIHNLEIEPQILNYSHEPFSDKENWMLVCDTFTSRSGREQYLIIGNFFLDEESDTTLLQTGIWYGSYYYIDDVSVIALDSVPSGVYEPEKLSFEVCPNPATDVVQIKGRRLAKARLLDMSGREVLHSSLPKIGGINISHLPLGLYLLEVTDREGRKAVQKLVLE